MPDQNDDSLDAEQRALQIIKKVFTLEEAAKRIARLNREPPLRAMFEEDLLDTLRSDAGNGLLRTGEPSYSRKQVHGVYRDIEHQTATGKDLVEWCDKRRLVFSCYQYPSTSTCSNTKQRNNDLLCIASLVHALLLEYEREPRPFGCQSLKLRKSNGEINLNSLKKYLTEIESLTPSTIHLKLKEALLYMEDEKKRR